MDFASLGSGSKGNATLVRHGETLLMIDCGFSLRETTRRMARLGLSPEQLDAVLVTHEHSDHCAGVSKLSAKHQVPVYLTHEPKQVAAAMAAMSYCALIVMRISLSLRSMCALLPYPTTLQNPANFGFQPVGVV